MAENNGINQPSNTQSTEPKAKDGSSLIKRLTSVAKEYPRIAALVGAVILGLVALWEGYGQWWFGFRISAWVLITLAVALNVVWLTAVCGYLAGLEKNKPKLPRSNTVFMIALPALVLGILGGYFAMDWRLTEKIVILVEPFEGDKEVPYDLAKTVKGGLERKIRLLDRHRVKVVLGKKHKEGSGKEVPLEERALKYRADMIISGWYTKRGSEILVSVSFYVVRVPRGLPAVFRRQESDYPRSLIFSKEEIENFTVNFTLEGLLEYEGILMIGAGAYASGEWKTAEHYFSKALGLIEKGQACARRDRKRVSECLPYIARKLVEQRRKKVYSEEYIEGDKALLELYIGHCLFNQGHLDFAIDRYHKAVKQGGEISESDARYREILTNAYLGRGIAYREKNEFDLAAHDFKRLGEYSLFSDGFIQPRAYESLYSNKGSVELKVYALRFYERGDKYLKNRAHAHAQSELETSVKMLRTLSNEAFTPKLKKECSFLLAQSLVRLGEAHSRQALPEIWNDEHTKGAIECLDEAHKIIKELKQDEADVNDVNDVFDLNALKRLDPDCLRHLGDVHRLMDRIEDVNNAINNHEDANNLWTDINDVNMAAGEQTRIGDTYRRLDDLDPNSKDCWLDKAIDAYHMSIKMVGGGKYLVSLESGSLEEQSVEQKKLVGESMKDITAHHLAGSLGNLAETHIGRYLAHSKNKPADPNEQDIRTHSKKQPADPNEDIRISCKLLECAVECYRESVKKLHEEKNEKWIKRIKEEERNMSLKDDLAWSLTLYGYALIKQGQVVDFNDPNCYYGRVTKILTKAGECFGKLRDVNQAHRVLSLFALTVSQVELDKEQEARKTFREACLLLRRLTREKKKVWYVDYVYDIMKNLPQWGFQFGTDDDSGNLEKIETWLTASTVREGRQALDKIITSVEK